MLKNKSFAFKLNFYLITSASILLVISFIVNYSLARQIILSKVETLAQSHTYENVNKIENVLNSVEKIPQNFSYIFEKSTFSDAQLHEILKNIVKNNDEIFGSCIAFEPGKGPRRKSNYAPYYYKDSIGLGYTNLGNDEYDFHNHDWYSVPEATQSAVWSEPYFDEGGGNVLMTTYSVPFYQSVKSENVFSGIITADISLEWIQRMISSITVLETGFAFLISPSGQIIAHPNHNLIMQGNFLEMSLGLGDKTTIELAKKMTSGAEGFTKFRSILLETDAMVYYTILPSSGWSLAIVYPEDELYVALDDINKSFIFFGIIFIVILVVVINILSMKLAKPLRSLSTATKVISKGNFDITLPETDAKDEIGVLTRSMQMMLKELKNYITNLQETTVAKEKIESELRIAHDIQMGMIPKTFPPFPNRSEIDIYAELHPAKEVGGDLYDFFFIDDNHLCITIGDVSGKGVPASLLMAVTRTLLRANAKPEMKSDELVNLINKTLCEQNDSRLFVTFLVVIVNLADGTFDCTNAGHNSPYLLKNNGNLQEVITKPKFPIGITSRKSYTSLSGELQVGDKLIFYTDGITEAMNKNEEMYEEDRLMQLLAENHTNSSKELTTKILDAVNHFTDGADQYDDMTVLVFEFKAQNITKELNSLFFEVNNNL